MCNFGCKKYAGAAQAKQGDLPINVPFGTAWLGGDFRQKFVRNLQLFFFLTMSTPEKRSSGTTVRRSARLIEKKPSTSLSNGESLCLTPFRILCAFAFG